MLTKLRCNDETLDAYQIHTALELNLKSKKLTFALEPGDVLMLGDGQIIHCPIEKYKEHWLPEDSHEPE